MNDILFRVLMSVVMVPLAITLYLLLFGFFANQIREEYALIWSSLFTGTLVFFYWLGVWRETVRWTSRRRLLTIIAVPAAIGLPLGAMTLLDMALPSRPELHILAAGLTAIPLWLILTLLIWKETPAERAERVQASAGKALFCPKCNYNMTGLYEARCPECGERFTLDQLMAAQQRNRLAEELSPPRQESSGPAK